MLQREDTGDSFLKSSLHGCLRQFVLGLPTTAACTTARAVAAMRASCDCR